MCGVIMQRPRQSSHMLFTLFILELRTFFKGPDVFEVWAFSPLPTNYSWVETRDGLRWFFEQLQNYFGLRTNCCTSCLGGRSKAIMQVKKSGLVTCGLLVGCTMTLETVSVETSDVLRYLLILLKGILRRKFNLWSNTPWHRVREREMERSCFPTLAYVVLATSEKIAW